VSTGGREGVKIFDSCICGVYRREGEGSDIRQLYVRFCRREGEGSDIRQLYVRFCRRREGESSDIRQLYVPCLQEGGREVIF
jgi:hypothetical protein